MLLLLLLLLLARPACLSTTLLCSAETFRDRTAEHTPLTLFPQSTTPVLALICNIDPLCWCSVPSSARLLTDGRYTLAATRASIRSAQNPWRPFGQRPSAFRSHKSSAPHETQADKQTVNHPSRSQTSHPKPTLDCVLCSCLPAYLPICLSASSSSAHIQESAQSPSQIHSKPIA